MDFKVLNFVLRREKPCLCRLQQSVCGCACSTIAHDHSHWGTTAFVHHLWKNFRALQRTFRTQENASHGATDSKFSKYNIVNVKICFVYICVLVFCMTIE